MSSALLDDPDELTDDGIERAPEIEYFEYVDGVGVEWREMSTNAQILGFELGRKLGNHGERTNHGLAMTEVIFRLPLERDRRRRPDVAYVPYSVWPKNKAFPDTNGWEALPSLCVEVISPSDIAEEIEDRVNDYLTAGVALVWVIYPRHKFVVVHKAGERPRTLYSTETLEGGTAVPGFALPLSEMFPPTI